MNEIDWKKFGHALDVISDKMEEAAMDHDASQGQRQAALNAQFLFGGLSKAILISLKDEEKKP